MGLWQQIRDWLNGREEPSLVDDQPGETTVEYPTADLSGERGSEKTPESQREGEGFR